MSLSKEQFKSLIEKINDELQITDAFCWEGDACYKLPEMPDLDKTPVSLTLNISGSSLVEHSGDVDGIRDQVSDLKGKKETIEFEGQKYDIHIFNSDCTIREEDPHGDDDYTVYVKGTVSITIKIL